MRYPTHVAAGFAAYACGALVGVVPAFAETGVFAAGIACYMGTMVPDLDHTESKLGRRLLPISALLGMFSGHADHGRRGAITHSLISMLVWAAIYVTIAATVIHAFDLRHPTAPWKAGWWAGNGHHLMGFLVGFGSHLLADCFTRGGTPVFWFPGVKRFPEMNGGRVSLAGIRTGGFQEMLFALACAGMAGGLIAIGLV